MNSVKKIFSKFKNWWRYHLTKRNKVVIILLSNFLLITLVTGIVFGLRIFQNETSYNKPSLNNKASEEKNNKQDNDSAKNKEDVKKNESDEVKSDSESLVEEIQTGDSSSDTSNNNNTSGNDTNTNNSEIVQQPSAPTPTPPPAPPQEPSLSYLNAYSYPIISSPGTVGPFATKGDAIAYSNRCMAVVDGNGWSIFNGASVSGNDSSGWYITMR